MLRKSQSFTLVTCQRCTDASSLQRLYHQIIIELFTMISMKKAFLCFVAVITLFASASEAASQCLGLGTTETEQACRSFGKSSECLAKTAFENANMTASCIWHSNQTVRVKDQQKLRSKSGSPLAVTGLQFRDSLCGLTATIEVPKTANGFTFGKYGLLSAC